MQAFKFLRFAICNVEIVFNYPWLVEAFSGRLKAIIMPPITRSGRRGRRGGANNNPPTVQEQAGPVQEEPVVVQPVQQNVQAVVVPQPAVPVYAPPNVDQVFE